MIDLNKYRSRENKIRKLIGIKQKNHKTFMNTEIFSTYINPYNGKITGIRDNEREKFYHFRQEDLIQFVGMINQRELHTSHFIQSIELEFKKLVDRDIEKYELINHMFDEKYDLEKKLTPFINLANDYNLTLDGLYDTFEELLKEKRD